MKNEEGKRNPLINRTQVRRMMLELSRSTRAGKFTRVSEQTLDDAEAALAGWVRQRVHSTPRVGKTL